MHSYVTSTTGLFSQPLELITGYIFSTDLSLYIELFFFLFCRKNEARVNKQFVRKKAGWKIAEKEEIYHKWNKVCRSKGIQISLICLITPSTKNNYFRTGKSERTVKTKVERVWVNLSKPTDNFMILKSWFLFFRKNIKENAWERKGKTYQKLTTTTPLLSGVLGVKELERR